MEKIKEKLKGKAIKSFYEEHKRTIFLGVGLFVFGYILGSKSGFETAARFAKNDCSILVLKD